MTNRSRIEERIAKKEKEIQELEVQIREARAYVQALHDVAKHLPREAETEKEADALLRPGSGVADARSALLKAGKPLHIVDLLRAMGREINRKNKIGVSGSLAAYVRKGEIFARPKPNTFGLIEFAGSPSATAAEKGPVNSKGPPENFGLDEADETAAA